MASCGGVNQSACLIGSDMLDGMGSAGTQIGNFLSNMAGGIFKFVILLGIGGAIVGIIYAVVIAITKKINKK
jgi:hypothetical protein